MSTPRPPAEAEFVKEVHEATKLYTSNHPLHAPEFISGSALILDVIHNRGYKLIDKDGNVVNISPYSLAMGLWGDYSGN